LVPAITSYNVLCCDALHLLEAFILSGYVGRKESTHTITPIGIATNPLSRAVSSVSLRGSGGRGSEEKRRGVEGVKGCRKKTRRAEIKKRGEERKSGLAANGGRAEVPIFDEERNNTHFDR
jgi:hypothetical protein